jgi:hypothetical protein
VNKASNVYFRSIHLGVGHLQGEALANVKKSALFAVFKMCFNGGAAGSAVRCLDLACVFGYEA